MREPNCVKERPEVRLCARLMCYFRRFFDAEKPFPPKKVPFYYGWVLVFAATIGVLASVPGQTMGVSVFTEHLLQAADISRVELSSVYLIGTLLSGLILPIGGRYIDLYGSRLMAIFAAWGLGLTLLYFSQFDRILAIFSLEQFRLVRLLAMAVGFFCIRFSGQGMLAMVSRTMLGHWFNRRRGLAAGISGIFIGFGFSIAPAALHSWIDTIGWRGVWLQLAFIIGILFSLFAYAFYRDGPEQCGLALDAGMTNSSGKREVLKEDVTKEEAIRSRGFWAVCVVLSCHAFIMTAITFHIVDLGLEHGVAEKTIISIFVPIAVVSTSMGLLVGTAVDYTRVKNIMMFMMVTQIFGVLSATELSTDVGFWGLILGLGASSGCFATVAAVSIPRYFGRKYLGSISGVKMMVVVFASSVGPLWLAISKSWAGSYSTGLYVYLLLPMMSLILTYGVTEIQQRN